MTSFYDSLKSLFSQGMAAKIAEVLEEKDTHINKAASQIIAGLLGVMAKKGHTPQIRNIFEEAGNINLISDVGIFDKHLTHPQQKIGDNFLEQLLGDKAEDFTVPISRASGISEVATNRLISVIAPSFPAFFGKKMVKDGMNFQTVIDQIRSQERNYTSVIPADLIKAFGLTTALNADKGQAKPQTVINTTTSGTTTTTTSTPGGKKRGKNSWITWLLIVIALCFIYFWWRSCNNPGDRIEFSSEYIAEPVDIIPEDNSTASNAPAEGAEVTAITEIALPNGTQIRGYRNGVEEKMVSFLNSDEYKNATAKDLEGKWFEFDNIDFEFGSATELKEASRPQLDNIIAILKAYRNARVMVASFADKRGTETANMKISEERAETIEKMLDKGGVGAQVVKVEGYGDTQAEYSAAAPENDRAKDRDIAIRFVK